MRGAATARHPYGECGQALPLVLGGVLMIVFCALFMVAFGGAITGKGRLQRAADLAALSAARSMRDDLPRLLSPAREPGGSINSSHLEKREYLARAAVAAARAAKENGVGAERVEVGFPDALSFAPLRVRVAITGELRVARLPDPPVKADAVAETVLPAAAAATEDGSTATASGGGYGGILVMRQGEGMRPDVAEAFDRMAAAAAKRGVALVINSGFRSDAEQAALFEANPDPRMVAPPGTSLHRCATELDLGPPAAYGWLAANAPEFGFVKRYSWEPWHFGFVEGPPPCSEGGEAGGLPGGPAAATGAPAGDGGNGGSALPAFVPARFREAVARAASRWNVSATLLAAQLMAESNFNPYAVSPAGAGGIAQFMPATAAAYGLEDRFDAEAAIDAQAHLMADLLARFSGQVALALAAYNAGPAPVAACGCVPAYPETQGYVARILALMGGAGATAGVPALEIRLVG